MDANEFSCRTASPRRKHDVAHCTTALCPAEIKSRWTYKEILEVKPASLPMDYISFFISRPSLHDFISNIFGTSIQSMENGQRDTSNLWN